MVLATLCTKQTNQNGNMVTLVYILKFDLNAKLKHSTLKYSFKAFDIFKKKKIWCTLQLTLLRPKRTGPSKYN